MSTATETQITEQDVFNFIAAAIKETGASMLTCDGEDWVVYDARYDYKRVHSIEEVSDWLGSRTPESIKAEKIAKLEEELAKLKKEEVSK